MFTRVFVATICISAALAISSCSQEIQDGPPTRLINVANINNPIPKTLPKSKYGNPRYYTIKNKKYWVLKSSNNYNKTGIASWYGTKFHGKLTSSREPYDMMKMTAASPELPIPCYVHVTNLENNKTIIVKVNDRGPFAENRIIDLSYAAARKLNIIQQGTALVRVTSIDIKQDAGNNTHHKSKLYAQVGAFSTLANARIRQTQIQKISGIAVTINHYKKDELYKVQIGPISSIDKSDWIIKTINSHFPKIEAFSVVY